MKSILILAVLSFTGAIANAQSVMPVLLECQTKGVHSQFTVQNLNLTPMPVGVEARQLQMVDGKATFGALQPGTHLELRDTSGVVAPKSNRTFEYRLSCERDCLVVLLAGMVTGRTK